MKPIPTIHQDLVEEKLKTDAADFRADYIDDAGFTRRVMDALPDALPAKIQSQTSVEALANAPYKLSSAQRFLIIFGLASIAAVIATVFLSSTNLLIDASMDLATDTITPAVVGVATIVLATLIVSISAALSKH